MRVTARLLQATVKYLTPGAPTGLTGIYTHASPRAALIYLYSSTISKLQAFPESSVYRQSTEALSKQRLAIVEAVLPEGYEAWLSRVNQKVQENPEILGQLKDSVTKTADGRLIVLPRPVQETDERDVEWDGQQIANHLEGAKLNEREATVHTRALNAGGHNTQIDAEEVELELEPALTAQQISEIEQKIGAGLIEEVIEVAEHEHNLVDKLLEYKPWEELVEKAPEGQWTYFERSTHQVKH